MTPQKLHGPYFTYLMHVTALRQGSARLRQIIVGGLLLIAASIALIFWVWRSPPLQ